MRKSAKKMFIACDDRWVTRQIKNNPKFIARKLTTEIETHLHKKVKPETVRRVFRINGFQGRVARKESFVSQKYQKARMQFADNHLRKS